MASNIKTKKEKGRRLQNRVVQKIHKAFPALREGDVKPAIMGESGTDIILSPAARDVFPLAIECKNQERLNVWDALAQAEAGAKHGTVPAVVFSRNRAPDYVALRFDDLLRLLSPDDSDD